MAFDGIVIANLVRDLNEKIVSGRISKIAQPERTNYSLPLKETERTCVCSYRRTPVSRFSILHQTTNRAR